MMQLQGLWRTIAFELHTFMYISMIFILFYALQNWEHKCSVTNKSRKSTLSWLIAPIHSINYN